NGPLGLEQGFDVARSPARGPGPLTFALAFSGNLGVRLEHGSERLSGGRVSLRYGGLDAADARGHALRCWLVVRPRRLEIRADGDQFGSSVAISGDTIVVGARGHRVRVNGTAGAAYVFEKPVFGLANATQDSDLTASDGAPGDSFGNSVAISGDTVVVGPSQHQVGANHNQGEAYVFVKPAGGWLDSTQTARLTLYNGAANDALGQAVAISGDTV